MATKKKTATAIPEIINNFNVYSKGTLLIGTSGKVSLPDLKAITETISGSGILGEYETSVIGQFANIEQTVPFRTLDDGVFGLMDQTKVVDLTFRASHQSTVRATGDLEYKGMRIVERGKFKEFKNGDLERGKQMGAELTFEVTYYLIEIDGVKKLEIDKLNSIYVVDGKDLLKKVRNQC